MLDHLSLDEYNENALTNVNSDIFALKTKAASTLFNSQLLTPSQSPTISSKSLKSTIDANKHAKNRANSITKLSSANSDQNNNSTSLSNFNFFDSSSSQSVNSCSCRKSLENSNELNISTLVSIATTQEDTSLFSSNSSATDIVIDVCLLAECCYNDLISQSGDNLIDLNSFSEEGSVKCCIHSQQQSTQNALLPYSFEILERWNISMITNKR
jgi:hypothetical protein